MFIFIPKPRKRLIYTKMFCPYFCESVCMKTFFTLLFSCLFFNVCLSQDDMIHRIFNENIRSCPGFKIPETEKNKLLRHYNLKSGESDSIIFQNKNYLPREYFNAYPLQHKSVSGASCTDSLFLNIYSKDEYAFIPGGCTKTNDGGFVICGTLRDNQITYNYRRAFAVKFNSDGDQEWMYIFDDNVFDYFYLFKVYETTAGNIILAGDIDYPDNSKQGYSYYTPVICLGSDGVMKWNRVFTSKLAQVDVGCKGNTSVIINSISDGLNGDIILCGTTYNCPSPMYSTIILFDEDGNVKWDTYYMHGSLPTSGAGAVLYKGNILVAGTGGGPYSGSDNVNNTHFVTLDYITGKVISSKGFKPDYSYPTSFYKSLTNWTTNLTPLNNGHFLIYGKMFDGFSGFDEYYDMFGLLEFDNDLNLVNSHSVNVSLKDPLGGTAYYSNKIYFDEDYRGFLTFFKYLERTKILIYTGLMQNQQFIKTKRITDTAGKDQLDFNLISTLKGGANLLLFQKADTSIYTSKLEIRKVYASDTSQYSCFGQDTVFASLPQLLYTKYDALNINEIEQNQLIFVAGNVNQSSFLLNKQEGCTTEGICDYIQIDGPASFCGSDLTGTFTAQKNKACGASVQWQIDSAAFSSLDYVSDSSVRITFRNNWQGYLYAMLPTGTCGKQPIDSFFIAVSAVAPVLKLGNDTALCAGNTIELHAGPLFKTYTWQDGSNDSVFTATLPGKYYVTTEDYCGTITSDSINIKPAPPVLIDLGNDLSKCNSDTIKITAPPDFISYSWSPSYNISSTTSQTIQVYPMVDTTYKLAAEKETGCFGYDSIRVTVNYSIPVVLGNDTSFCKGDSLVLDAGDGYIAYYWNNADTARQITVKDEGQYIVNATSNEFCISNDTINIIVNNNPVVKLDKDSALCFGEIRILDAGAGYEEYLWSNGSTNESIPADTTGIYKVTVTDKNGCNGNDSVVINSIVPLPSDFLGTDTSVCQYGSITISPVRLYQSYLWSNGNNATSANISSPGMYWLQVTDVNGCTGRDTINVAAKECAKGLYMPTGFTPNNDGKNDVCRPLLFGSILKYHFVIYNRWGTKVFESSELQKGWDGKINGIIQDTGTYMWICSYQLAAEEMKMEKGNVVLIR